MDNLFSKISDKIFVEIEDIEIRFQNVISTTPIIFKILSFIIFAILKLLVGIILLMIGFISVVLILFLLLTLNQVISKFFNISIAILISILFSIKIFIDLHKYSRKRKFGKISQGFIEKLRVLEYVLLIILTLHSLLKFLNIKLN